MAEPAEIGPVSAGPRLVVRFAVADLLHDRFLTVMGIVLLAALLAPPVVLHTLRVGLVETWARDLARDIRNREIVIVGENRITAADLAAIAAWPETGFLVPEPSFFVSTQRARKSEGRGPASELNLRTTAQGDPVLAAAPDAAPTGAEIVLTARAAAQLGVGPGEQISLLLSRTPAGAGPERRGVDLRITAVLDERRWPGVTGFVAAETLLGVREWLTFRSEDPGAAPPTGGVTWQSVRIYAPEVALAPALRDRLDAAGFETRLMTDQVDRILKLETGLRQIFLIVLLLSATAFVITGFLLQWLSVVRKKRDFALMSVLGLTTADLAVFPAVQGAVMTAIACLLVSVLTVALQGPIDGIVQGYLTTPSPIQAPDAPPLVAGFVVAIGTGAVAGVAAVWTLQPRDLVQALRGD